MNYADKKEHGEVKDLEMAAQQLRNIHANAVDLLRHLEKHPHCPLLSQAWVQSKVTLSNAYVDSVRDYVVNSQKELEPTDDDGVYDSEDGVYDSEDGPVGFLVAVEKGASKY